jgi:hypothetical protein
MRRAGDLDADCRKFVLRRLACSAPLQEARASGGVLFWRYEHISRGRKIRVTRRKRQCPTRYIENIGVLKYLYPASMFGRTILGQLEPPGSCPFTGYPHRSSSSRPKRRVPARLKMMTRVLVCGGREHDDIDARRFETSENLHRAESTVPERNTQVAEQIQLTSEKPETAVASCDKGLRDGRRERPQHQAWSVCLAARDLGIDYLQQQGRTWLEAWEMTREKYLFPPKEAALEEKNDREPLASEAARTFNVIDRLKTKILTGDPH